MGTKRHRNGEPPPLEPKALVCPRYWCNDVTMEALARCLLDAPRGLLASRDELRGWLASFNQYNKGGKGSDLNHWLALHGGRDLLIDRKTGDRPTIYVPQASVSITGGTQPGILGRNLDREHFE